MRRWSKARMRLRDWPFLIVALLTVFWNGTVMAPFLAADQLNLLKASSSLPVPDANLSQDMLRDRLQMRQLYNPRGPLDSAPPIPSATAFNLSTLLDIGNSRLSEWLSRAKADERLPDWLKRVDLAGRIGTGQPSVYVETTQPILQSVDFSNTLFAQGRATLRNGTALYTGGLGYRRTFLDNQLVVGANTFYDYDARRGHARIGLGGEILSPVGELRVNYYDPTSNARQVSATATSYEVETAVSGYEVEAGAPVPFMPDLKLYAKHQVWDMKGGKDLVRDGGRAEWYLASFFRIDAETWYDNVRNNWAHRVGVVLRGDFDTTSRGFLFRGFRPDAYKSWTDKDVRWITTYRVVREFDIMVERTTRTSSGTSGSSSSSSSSSSGDVTINLIRGTGH